MKLIICEKPYTLEQHIKDKIRARKIKQMPRCSNCLQLDYEYKFIAGVKTRVCSHCWIKEHRIVIPRITIWRKIQISFIGYV